MVRVRGALAWTALAALPLGCQVVAGVDFGAVHSRDQMDLDGGAGGGGDGTPGPPCENGQKSCSGACVSPDDPAYGCTTASCAACSVPFAVSLGCRGGACVETACASGRGDCDGDPSNGCETDLTDVQHCAWCTVACTAGQVCAPAGCMATCPPGLLPCGTSCVDVSTSAAHCGNCTTRCAAAANANPACSAGACTIACHSAFADCDQNPKNGCEAMTVYYADGDKDGYGVTATTKLACTAPTGYSATAGDCADDNANVHPGQTTYFGTSYTDGAGKQSFDYNCNGADELASEPLFQGCFGTCSGSSGYTAAACGSTTIGYCVPYPTCSTHTTSGSPYPCR